jgi:hypothetical protein
MYIPGLHRRVDCWLARMHTPAITSCLGSARRQTLGEWDPEWWSVACADLHITFVPGTQKRHGHQGRLANTVIEKQIPRSGVLLDTNDAAKLSLRCSMHTKAISGPENCLDSTPYLRRVSSSHQGIQLIPTIIVR